MRTRTNRRYELELKRTAVWRMEAGEAAASLSVELGVPDGQLYAWHRAFRRGGIEGLLPPGRPRNCAYAGSSELNAPPGPRTVEAELASARHRVAVLERRLGQQALEADFFKSALSLLETFRRPNGASGGSAPSISSEITRSDKVED